MAEVAYALRSFLKTDADVSTAFGERISVSRVPDNQALPFALIRIINQPQEFSHDGPGNVRGMYQVDVYDDSEVNCQAHAELIRSALNGRKGMMGDVMTGYVWVSNTRGEYVPDLRNYRRIMEVTIATERNP